MEIKEADYHSSACVGLHRESNCAELCNLCNCSLGDDSLLDAGREMMKLRAEKTNTCCEEDSNRKKTKPLHLILIPDLSTKNSSSTSNPNAQTNTEFSPTSIGSRSPNPQETTSTSLPLSSTRSTPSNLHHSHHRQQQQQQQNVSSDHPDSVSDCREDLESEVFSSNDREFDFLQAPLFPRSSSLKSRKTPPGTPTHRKSVRFADALGLDLELVRHILNPDDPPHVPSTAVRFLETSIPLGKVISYWRVSFPHPATSDNLTDRVLRNKVSLESCSINNSNRRVYGTIRVANVAYEKDVSVRYTLNGWLTCEEVPATYIEHSNDLITDRFSFEATIPDHLVARSRLEFAVRFCAGSHVFWDNNFTRNYALECVDYHSV